MSAGKDDDEARQGARARECGRRAPLGKPTEWTRSANDAPAQRRKLPAVSCPARRAAKNSICGYLRYEIRIWSEVEARVQHALLACSACARLCSKVLPSLGMAHALGRNVHTDRNDTLVG
ncbi:unnamed protein product [Ixodes persulcatus]